MRQDPKQLNKLEIWVADHAVPIFAVLAVLILLGAAAVFFTYQEQTGTAERVKVLSPQVTRINRAMCDRRSLQDVSRARRCAERIRVGLVNCRHYQPCRAALLAAITYPPPARSSTPATSPEPSPGSAGDTGGGDAHQPSSHGHQQPGPGKGPNQPAGAAPSPSPGQGGEGAPEPSPGANGGSGGQQGGSSSGADVEVCVLEGTCVGIEAGVDPKGLTSEPPIRRASTPPGTPEAAP